MTEDTKLILGKLDLLQDHVTGVEERLGGLEGRMTGVEERLGGLEGRMTGVEERLDGLDGRITEVKERIGGLDGRITEVEGRLQQGITSINLTLENEIRPNIRFLAEGHMDLTRKLDEALKVEREKEWYMVRFHTVENDVRILKEKMAQFA